MAKKIDKTVFVGVSGGVDSSVAAALLKEQGYNVVGVFIRTWTPEFIKCTWKEERRDAMRVCAHLDIPFLECDAEESYKKGVADYMINEYKIGNTPNPDVMCNREVKFGIFWEFAKARGADFIATGHYARVLPVISQDKFELHTGLDFSKDQSYFLWTLTQDDLDHTIFPVGHLQKIEVRKIANKYNLPTATKKDSQGVCFLGPLDMKDFLKHYIEPKMGDVIDEEENVIGSHDGATFFTLGERHGFTINKNINNSLALYVVSKNIEANTLTVSSKNKLEDYYLNNNISGFRTNWIFSLPKKDKKYTAQIRYHGELLICSIKILEDNKCQLFFDKNIIIDKGQSIVFFDKDNCLGGCIVG